MSMLKRIGAYLGLVEEYDDYDDYDEFDEELADERPRERRRVAPPPEPGSRAEPSNVRRITPVTRDDEEDERSSRPIAAHTVHVTNPTTFNDVEEVGERFRAGVPVIMNLAGASESVAKRLLDFGSGLIFGLDGRIERVGDRVFLLSPAGVEVSSEERRKLGERGFFNQA